MIRIFSLVGYFSYCRMQSCDRQAFRCAGRRRFTNIGQGVVAGMGKRRDGCCRSSAGGHGRC